MKIFNSRLRQELTVMARNGEQLLLLVVIPVMLLIFFSQTDFLPTGDENKINFLMPGILSLGVMSTAMASARLLRCRTGAAGGRTDGLREQTPHGRHDEAPAPASGTFGPRRRRRDPHRRLLHLSPLALQPCRDE